MHRRFALHFSLLGVVLGCHRPPPVSAPLGAPPADWVQYATAWSRCPEVDAPTGGYLTARVQQPSGRFQLPPGFAGSESGFVEGSYQTWRASDSAVIFLAFTDGGGHYVTIRESVGVIIPGYSPPCAGEIAGRPAVFSRVRYVRTGTVSETTYVAFAKVVFAPKMALQATLYAPNEARREELVSALVGLTLDHDRVGGSHRSPDA